ncbi:MAG: tetratricopeptide repeat protein [Acidobacteriaceae bacterium]
MVDMRVSWVTETAIVLAAVLALAAPPCLAQSSAASSTQRDTAFALEQQGRFADAEAAWQSILKTHPDNAEAFAHLGFLESHQQHYPQAVTFYRRAFALNPSMPGLQLNFGLALFKAGDLKQAARAFEPLYRKTAPDSDDAQRLRLLLGMAYYGAAEYAAAVPYLRDAMARDPQNLPYRLVLAHSCLWSKQYKCVLDVYHQILTLNAESAEADMLAGEAYDSMLDHADAIQQFRNAVKADPKEPGVHFGLGYLLWCQSQFDEAAEQFQLETENAPNDAESLAYWADSNVRLNRPDVARPILEKALRLNSKQELPWLDLGIIDATAGHNDDALREFKTAARLTPADIQVHWRLGRLYQSMGDRALAQAEFAKTKNLTQAADKTVMEKLRASHAQDAPANANAASSNSQQPNP